MNIQKRMLVLSITCFFSGCAAVAPNSLGKRMLTTQQQWLGSPQSYYLPSTSLPLSGQQGSPQEILMPLLDKNDIIIDGGNSFFKDTERRMQEVASKKIRFIGMGISGGEEGALRGPSIMPSGEASAYEELLPFLNPIAAKVNSGPCVTYVGKGGSGHFVKMIHNGIEYGDMQLIAETYDIFRKGFGLHADEISRIFEKWNKGILHSYLIEITAKVLQYKEPKSSQFLVDKIQDVASQKGTGLWTIQAAMDEGVAIPTIEAAVQARLLSALKKERLQASKAYQSTRN